MACASKEKTGRNRLWNGARAFARDRSGAAAAIFAIAMPLVAVLALGAVDYSRASSARQSLQDSLDSAALAVARSTLTDATQMNTLGVSILRSQLNANGGMTLVSSPQNFVASNNTIVADASATIQPVLTSLFGATITLAAHSEVVRSINKIEVAMVLDTTGSMADTLGSGTKMTALKSAASSLVDILSAAAQRASDPNSVKIAVVPFSMTVRVAPSNKNSGWITGVQPAAYGADLFTQANTDRFALLAKMGLTWAGCVESRPAPYDVQDTGSSPSVPATMFVPYFAPDEPDNNKISNGWGYYSFTNNYITNDLTGTTWQARQGNANKYGTSNWSGFSRTDNGTGSKGPNKGCSMAAMQPLLTVNTAANATAVKNQLNTMQPNGNTNIAMGAMWGWHMLSPTPPFTPASPYSAGALYTTDKLSKVMILLTDGDNTNDTYNNPENSIYTGVGYMWQKRLLDASLTPLDETSSSDDRMLAIDSREALVCTNMKAKGIIIYTIGVGVSDHSRSGLSACASSPDKYFDVTDSAQLSSVFSTIAGQINNLRISK